jgi:hypothetical protein
MEFMVMYIMGCRGEIAMDRTDSGTQRFYEKAIVLWLEGGAIKLIWSVINVRISRRIRKEPGFARCRP